MKTVSVFDMTMQGVREHRFSRHEALQIIDELRLMYPDVFELSGIEGESPADFAERIPDGYDFDERMQDTEPISARRDIDEDEI